MTLLGELEEEKSTKNGYVSSNDGESSSSSGDSSSSDSSSDSDSSSSSNDKGKRNGTLKDKANSEEKSRERRSRRSGDRRVSRSSPQRRSSASPIRKERSPSPKPKKIHVGKLTRNINKDHLQEIFSVYGTVKTVDMPMDRFHPEFSRGYAYIDFESPEDAENAIKFMDGGQLDGQEITASAVLMPRPLPRAPARRYGHRDFSNRRGDSGRGFRGARSPPRRPGPRIERRRSPIRRRSPPRNKSRSPPNRRRHDSSNSSD